MESDSGTIAVEDGVIKFGSREYGDWKVPVTSIRLIGEYSTQDGPFAEDDFLVLCDGRNEFEVPSSAVGIQEVMGHLSQVCGVEVVLTLGLTTDFSSRIIFPCQLAERPLFEFVESNRGLFSKIRRIVGFGAVHRSLTNEATIALDAKT